MAVAFLSLIGDFPFLIFLQLEALPPLPLPVTLSPFSFKDYLR